MSEVAKRKATINAGADWQPTEEQEQAAVFEWVTIMRNRLPELDLLHHIPNGGDRHPAVAAKLKAQGVKRGVPDLCLPVARGGFHGLYIELKRKKGGRVSEDQHGWLSELSAQGYRAEVCHGAEEACDVLYKYLTEVEQ